MIYRGCVYQGLSQAMPFSAINSGCFLEFNDDQKNKTKQKPNMHSYKETCTACTNCKEILESKNE